MLNYYTCLIIILLFTICTLCTLIYENDRLGQHRKKRFYFTCLFIGLAALTEWIGLSIANHPEIPSIILRGIKCLDYILTPFAGGALLAQLNLRNIWSKTLNAIIGFNIVFQIISFFTGWMVIIDDNNCYTHGQLYIVYTLVYMAIILIVIIQFHIYGKNFRKLNRASLNLIMGLVVLGVLLQEYFKGEVRTAYLTLTIGAVLMFIHSTEYSQQKTDDYILEQQIQIKTDALTGLLSRRAYSKALSEYKEKMPMDFVVFSIDINGLKTVNDTKGHEAGDELICGTARCIEKVFEDIGSCYRTGGDEFIVFASLKKDEVETVVEQVNQVTRQWKGKLVQKLSLSVGYAALADYKDYTCEELVRVADQEMYEAKNEYYMETGLDRRRV